MFYPFLLCTSIFLLHIPICFYLLKAVSPTVQQDEKLRQWYNESLYRWLLSFSARCIMFVADGEAIRPLIFLHSLHSFHKAALHFGFFFFFFWIQIANAQQHAVHQLQAILHSFVADCFFFIMANAFIAGYKKHGGSG